MEKLKKVLDRIFIDGLSGMAQGLFATLIIGTIVQQIGTLIGGSVGDMIFAIGKVAASLTGAGIGVGVAAKFKESQLVTVSAGVAGMAGAFASNLLAGTVLVDGTMVYSGPGGTSRSLYCCLCRHRIRTYGIRKDKSRDFGNTYRDDRNRISSRSASGPSDLSVYDRPWRYY